MGGAWGKMEWKGVKGIRRAREEESPIRAEDAGARNQNPPRVPAHIILHLRLCATSMAAAAVHGKQLVHLVAVLRFQVVGEYALLHDLVGERESGDRAVGDERRLRGEGVGVLKLVVLGRGRLG